MRYTYCLICKSTENLTWHHIIPKAIAKHITNFKYTDKDIVCLCNNCHITYHKVLTQQLVNTFSYFNLDLRQIHRDIRIETHEHIRRKITALKNNIPTEIRIKYITEIKEAFNDFTEDQITYYEKICKSKRFHFSAENYLVNKVKSENLLNYYREHFTKYATKKIKKLNKQPI